MQNDVKIMDVAKRRKWVLQDNWINKDCTKASRTAFKNLRLRMISAQDSDNRLSMWGKMIEEDIKII